MDIQELVGQTPLSIGLGRYEGADIEPVEYKVGSIPTYVCEMLFIMESGRKFKFYHDQDCCESVYVNDIVGDLNDLVGVPLLQAEEARSKENPPQDSSPDSFTWTFYKFATIKGSVTVRWFGESNGYYSESVELEEIND